MTAGPQRIVTRVFGLLTAAHFLQALGFSSMVLLPVFLDHLGADRTEIGLVMGISAVSSLASRPLVAWALDTFGRRPTIIVGTVVLSLGMFCFAAVSRMGAGVYAARLLSGAGTGTLFTGYFALAADIVPVDRRTQGLALFGISGLVPLMINPMAQSLGVAPADIGVFFGVLGLLIMASLGPLMMIPEPRKPSSDAQEPMTLTVALAAVSAPAVRPVWLATVALSGLVSAFFAFSTVTAEHRGLAYPALLWVAYGGGAAAVRVIFAFMPLQVAPRRFIPPAFVLYAVAALTVAMSETDLGFASAGLFAGLAHGMGFPVLVSQVASRMPDRLRGSGMSGFTGLWELAALCVTPLLGAVADVAGDGWMFIVAAVSAVVAMLIWTPVERRYGPRDEVG